MPAPKRNFGASWNSIRPDFSQTAIKALAREVLAKGTNLKSRLSGMAASLIARLLGIKTYRARQGRAPKPAKAKSNLRTRLIPVPDIEAVAARRNGKAPR